MNTLCFGGSFNPIHNGHIGCARAVASDNKIDRVLLIPTFQTPHKLLAKDIASPFDRLAMCRLVADKDPLFEVSDIEIERGGPSYTLDTVRELCRQGMKPVRWLIGADAVIGLPKWHKVTELLAEVEFVIVSRPGFQIDWMALSEPFRKLQNQVVNAPLFDVGATEIRRRVRAGQPIDTLTLPSVAKYIVEHDLYR